jgi:hypothetical protein
VSNVLLSSRTFLYACGWVWPFDDISFSNMSIYPFDHSPRLAMSGVIPLLLNMSLLLVHSSSCVCVMSGAAVWPPSRTLTQGGRFSPGREVGH